MSQHTPGPWIVNPAFTRWKKRGNPIVAPDAIILTTGESVLSTSEWLDVDDADLLMMAAAPDLLAALEEVVRISDRKNDAWDAAKAAIRKARGEC